MFHRWPSRLTLSLALALAGASTGARAQELDASHYDGTWTARLPCASGTGTCSARLVIKDFEGSWQDLSGASVAKRACGGKKMKLTVQRSTHSQLAFTVFGDGVSTSCPTLSVVVRPVNAKRLEGTFESGIHATESPEVHASHSSPSGAGSAAGATAGGSSTAKTIRLERR
jgi:hypothetical protein